MEKRDSVDQKRQRKYESVRRFVLGHRALLTRQGRVVEVGGRTAAVGSDRTSAWLTGSTADNGRSISENGGSWPTRFEYGGDPSRVTLIAHSFGGFIANEVIPGDFPPGPDCLYQEGSYKPDQYVSVAAIISNEQVGASFLASDYPDAVDIRASLATAKRIPVLVVQGTIDNVARLNEYSRPYYDALVAAGWQVRYVEGLWDHSSPLVMDEVLDAIAR